MVIRRPLFRYSVKLNVTPCRFADSATIKFATEPNKVRLPAKVDDIAKANQYISLFCRGFIIGLKTKTAGTFEIILLNIKEIIDKSTNEFPLNNSILPL